MKKILAMLMAALMLFSSCGIADIPFAQAGFGSSAAKAESTGSQAVSEHSDPDGWLYTLCEDGSATITGYTDRKADNLRIPRELNGAPVTAVADRAFAELASLSTITIPTRVVHLGTGLFAAPDRVRISAYQGSAAQAYAAANGIRFTSLSTQYDFRDDVIDLTGEASSITVSGNTLLLPAALKDLLKVNDVFFYPARDSKKLEIVVGIVASVQRSGDQVRVSYLEGGILHAVDELSVSSADTKVSAEIRWDPTVIEDATGQWEKVIINKKDSLEKVKTTSKRLKLKGDNYIEAGFDLGFALDYHIKAGARGKDVRVWTYEVFAEIKQFDLTLNVTPYVKGEIELVNYKSGRKKLADVTFYSTGAFSVSAALYMEVDVSGKVSFAIEQSNSMTLSWLNSKKKFDYYANSYTKKKELRIDANIDLKLIPELYISIVGIKVLSGEYIIHFDFDAYAVVRRLYPLATCVDLKLKMIHSIQVRFGLLSGEYTKTFFNKKIKLFSKQLFDIHLEDWKTVSGCQREAKKVTFETNGGTKMKPIEDVAWATKVFVTNPTRSGYKFEGWYSNKALTKAWNSSMPITSNITLYAKWTKKNPPKPNTGIPDPVTPGPTTPAPITPSPVTPAPGVVTPTPTPSPTPSPTPTPTPVPVTGVVLSTTAATLYTEMGQSTLQLTATISPENAANKAVYWESSNPDVAHVDTNGLVTALAAGNAVITCAAADNTAVRTTCQITVIQPVTGVLLSNGESAAYALELLNGENVTLTAQTLPEDASNNAVVWTSSNEQVASVSSTGLVTAVGAGTATIRSTAKDGFGAFTECTIRVENQLEVNTQVVNDTFYRCGGVGVVGYVTPTSRSMLRMQNAGHKITYTISRSGGGASTADIHTVETTSQVNGVTVTAPIAVIDLTGITGTGKDTYTVTCKAGTYTETATFTVTVVGEEGEYAQNATLPTTTFTFKAGESITVPASPIAVTAGEKIPAGLTMTLVGNSRFNADAVVTETAEGTFVTFAKPGDYTAEAVYTVANIRYSVPVTFYVTDENGMRHLSVESVSVSGNTGMVVGDTQQLTCEVLPADAYDRRVEWSTSDPTIATVSADGKVKALKAGWVGITATALDGSEESSSVMIYVEGFLQLAEEETLITIYQTGATSQWIDGVQLTAASAERIAKAGRSVVWALEHVSGNAAELALSEDDMSSGNNSVVLGNKIHVLRINEPGTDHYRVTCTSGSDSVTGYLTLVVSGNALPGAVSLAKTTYEVNVNEPFELITNAVCSPAGSLLPEATDVFIDAPVRFWNHLADEYSTSNGYMLTMQTPGIYEINVVYSGSNYRYEVPVTLQVRNTEGVVPDLPTGIALDQPYLSLFKGSTAVLKATVTPSNAQERTVTWASADPSVATVAADGTVTAVAAGTVIITATCASSGVSAYCVVEVEQGLTLGDVPDALNVYLDGLTRTKLTEVFLTDATSSRLSAQPTWTLTRVSGNTLTLRTAPMVLEEDGNKRYGCEVILYSVSKLGETVYDLTCTAGNESVTKRIKITSVSRSDSIPSAIMFRQSEYSAGLDEIISVRPIIVCSPESAQLPQDVRVTCTLDKQTLAALNQDDYFVSRPMSTFSFHTPGTYTVVFNYAHSNVEYHVPVTFRVRDASGAVPVQGSRITLSRGDLQLTPGQQEKVDVVFTPADATNQKVVWSSSDPSVATVAADGTVTAVACGTAVLSCVPDDQRCAAAECTVTVEEPFTVDTGADAYELYLQGKADNTLFVANLTPGTLQRMKAKGLTPEWTLTRTSGSHAQVVMSVSPTGDNAVIETEALVSAGTDVYELVCIAGTYSYTKQFTVSVMNAGNNVPQNVTLQKPVVQLSVGQSTTVDFAPVCEPAGSLLPGDMMAIFTGFGDFYDALDRTVYKTTGTKVTVAFTKPGSYLLGRSYLLGNLTYTALCRFDVGNVQTPALLSATNTEYTVYMNGKSAEASVLKLEDYTFFELLGDELVWTTERLSGSSLKTGLKVEGSSATLLVLDAEKEGTDVWQVRCSFRGITLTKDITIHAVQPRKPLPDDIELSKNTATGMIGNPITLPVGANCLPAGTALPDTGDDFWFFRMADGLGEAMAEYGIENGVLKVTFRESGYYTGILTYASGNIRFDKEVYFTICDEEDVVAAPTALRLFLLGAAETVYPEGNTKVGIATAAISENLNSYYAGTIPAYVKEKGIRWEISRQQGSAATLSLKETVPGQAQIVLDTITGTGDVTYLITCELDGTTYTQQYKLHVALAGEARPKPQLSKRAYTVYVGDGVTIDRNLYDGYGGVVLQSASSWNAGNALSAMNHSFDTYTDAWSTVFYQAGIYETSVTASVGNLSYVLPLTIKVLDGSEPQQQFVFTLPAKLKDLQADAFSGLPVNVIDASGTALATIGSKAFANCVDLTAVYLPASVSRIADDAFESSVFVVIHCAEGSYADTWAQQHGVSVSYDMTH